MRRERLAILQMVIRLIAITVIVGGLTLTLTGFKHGGNVDVAMKVNVPDVEQGLLRGPALVVEGEDSDLHIHFKREIRSIEIYEPLIERIYKLKKGDKLTMHFSNFGGSVYTGAALFNALSSTNATTHAIIEAPSFSMGAMLPCAADTIDFKPFSWLMFHDYSGTFSGKGSESKQMMQAFDKLTARMMGMCERHGILTPSQIDRIKSGEDIYIHPEDVK